MGERLWWMVVPDLVGVLKVRVGAVGEGWPGLLSSSRCCGEPWPALGDRDRPVMGRRGELIAREALWSGEPMGLVRSSPVLS
jgi:hypothetical protein